MPPYRPPYKLPPLERNPGPYRDTAGPQLPKELLDQFMTAVDENDLDTFKSLLDEHFPDRTKVYAGKYRIYRLNDVLKSAALQDKAPFVDELLHYPFHTYGFVALAALSVGAKKTFLVLLQHGWDINGTLGATGLPMLAYAMPDEDMVLWLVAHGADPNARPYVDTTPLSMAVKHASPALVRTLLDDCGGSVHRGQLLQYALERATPATASDTVEMLGLLLDRGAPLNATMYADDPPSYGMYHFIDWGTPLHKAAAVGNAEAAAFLLARGADPRVRSTKGKTVRAWAEAAGHGDVLAVLRAHERRRLWRRGWRAVVSLVCVCLLALAAYGVQAFLRARFGIALGR